MFNKAVTLVSSVFPPTAMLEVPRRLLQALQFDNGICLIETAFRLPVFPTQWLAGRVIYYSPSSLSRWRFMRYFVHAHQCA
jgi:hypothetical protein